MLVLTRKSNESIQVGDDIEIKVIAIDGDQVKIGIDAPKSVDIYRKEIFVEIQKQNSEAVNLPSDLLHLLKGNQDKK